eukprot:sb/3467738/
MDEDITEEREIYTFLQYHVDDMIEKAAGLQTDNSPELPLIRLRYEYGAEHAPINGVKFGHDYATRVANPKDILLAVKKKERSATGGGMASAGGAFESDNTRSGGGEDEGEDSKTMADYTLEILKEMNKPMMVLGEKGLSIACEDMVHKLENESIQEYINFAMEQCESHLRANTKLDDNLIERMAARKAPLSLVSMYIPFTLVSPSLDDNLVERMAARKAVMNLPSPLTLVPYLPSPSTPLSSDDNLVERMAARKAVMSREDATEEINAARQRWEQRRKEKMERGEV